MKKLLLLLPLFFIFSVAQVTAAESVSFSAESKECDLNRLIDVNVSATCGKKLCAATFDFTFNKSVLEFRDVITPKNASAEYAEAQNGVKLIYLCKGSADISSSAAIFTLKFKSIAAGSTDISYTVSDCVDDDVDHMSVGSCTSGNVTVLQKTDSGSVDTTKGSRKTSSSADDKEAKSSSSSKSKSDAFAASTKTTSAINDLGNVNDVIQRDYDRATPLIILCVSIVIALAFIGFLVFKITSKYKTKDKQDKDK